MIIIKQPGGSDHSSKTKTKNGLNRISFSVTSIIPLLFIVILTLIQGNECLKISPKPCTNAVGEEGTCMFVWECIKTDGKHLGTCVDGFLFGSCCGHNETTNEITHSWMSPSSSSTTSSFPPSSSSSQSAHFPSSPDSSSSSYQPPSSSSSGSVSTQTLAWPDFGLGGGTSSSFWATDKPVTSPFDTALDPPLDDVFPSVVSPTTTSPPHRPYPSSTPSFPSHSNLPSSSSSSSQGSSSSVSSPGNSQQQSSQQHHQHQQQIPHHPLWQPASSITSPVQSPSNGAAINVIGPSKWPPSSSSSSSSFSTPSTTTSTMNTAPSVATTSVMHTFRPPIFSIFGTHRPPSGGIFMKPGRPTRPPIMRPPIFPNRPTISVFQPFNRPTPVPVFPANHHPQHQHHSTTPSHLMSSTPTTTSTSTVAPESLGSSNFPSIHDHHYPPSPSSFPTSSGSPTNAITASSSNQVITSAAGNVTRKPVTPALSKVECGLPPLLPQTKVVGGKNAAFGSWPWQVSVRRTSFFGFSSTHRCGGAIINNHWIATAGHCVDDLLLSQIRIRVGEYDFASAMEPFPYVERGAKKKVVHPHYNFFTYENDLALVQLDEPLEFQPHISPICLPPDQIELVGRNATVTGWGRLSEGGILPSVLQEVRVPIVSNDKCKGMFLNAGRHEYIPEIFMCAGYPEGGRDSCQGDSGGPLQVQGDDGKWFLAGIISWGIGCAEPNLPGVCTRITKFKNWIVNTVN